MSDVELTLRPASTSVSEARRAVERLAGGVEDRLLQDLRLLVSEVVTNAIRHAGLSPSDAIELRISVDRTRVRVEVHDAGPGFEPPDAPRTIYQESGFGLFLVDRLADRWGVTTDEGTTVWFEIDR